MPKRFVKSLVLISFMLIFAAGVMAQTGCDLTNAPRLLGFALGMSPTQAQAVVGKDLKIKVKPKGQRTFFQNFIKEPPPISLPGVRALYLRFLDGRLYQIEIFYQESDEPQTLANFTASLSATMNLPADLWRSEYNIAAIDCAAFRLSANVILNPYVELTDKAARAKAEAMRKENSE